MAIQKMKKLKLAVLDSKRDDLLKALVKCGCVQIDEMEEELAGTGYEELLSKSDSDLISLKEQHQTLTSAISILNGYAPQKSKLLSAKPELEKEVFLDETGLAEAVQTAKQIVEKEGRIKRIAGDESRERSNKEALLPWANLDMPLDCEGTQTTAVYMGMIPARVSLDKVERELENVSELIQLDPISTDKSQHYVVLICAKDVANEALETLRGFGFTLSTLSGQSGVAKANIMASKAHLSKLFKERKNLQEEITALGDRQSDLKLAADKLATRIAIASSDEKMFHTETSAVFTGWVPEESVPEVEKIFGTYDCAWSLEDPAPEEYGEVPVKLKNNKFTNALNMVTEMYSLPRYGTLDPNPLMAPFFILFFGLMMADMGYGIIMVVAAAIAMKKIKPRKGSLYFCQLLLYCGIATFVCGALTGSFFSDVLEQLFGIQLPYLFSPVKNSTMVLYGSMALGALHLNTGLAINFYKKAKSGNLISGLCEEVPLWVILIGGILMAIPMLTGKAPGLKTVGLVILIIGVAALLIGSGYLAYSQSKKITSFITAPFGALYNTVTGWFGDILSYSRIMALMLAGAVIGQVFNTVATMPMKGSGVNPLTIIVFVIIFLLGHAMNLGLNLLGCYVHDLRLQALEYFGKFYEDGGRAFTPLTIDGKYLRTKENN
ncbi:MAG: V-type ATP synthase subunit I [Lachnospiraceae bacterium]|nr:V-type ATP synthase subunit I [Lachnospiraceae bacterium]